MTTRSAPHPHQNHLADDLHRLPSGSRSTLGLPTIDPPVPEHVPPNPSKRFFEA